ncbi:MAG: hypothetical protein IIB62_11600 [Proteobacteria bacterium]|nr:hypothetical protein [Pseudomonadota bacterium]
MIGSSVVASLWHPHPLKTANAGLASLSLGADVRQFRFLPVVPFCRERRPPAIDQRLYIAPIPRLFIKEFLKDI